MDDAYEYFEDQIQFNDSYNAMERAGFDDEGWKRIETTFEGDRSYELYQTPKERFEMDVQNILTFTSLPLDQKDKRILVAMIDFLDWIEFKIPKTYVLGYFVWRNSMSEPSIQQALQQTKNTSQEKFTILQYARYWDLNLRFRIPENFI